MATRTERAGHFWSKSVLSKQGQGNQCRTPGVKFKEKNGIDMENEIYLEETERKKHHGVRKVYHGIREVYHGVREVYHDVRKVYHSGRKV